MKRIDATVPLGADTPVWPGEARVTLRLTSSIEHGQPCNLTEAHFGLHAGTHLDAPKHFIQGGIGVDELDLDILIGEAYVLDISHINGTIEDSHLAGTPRCERLILKTSNTVRGLMRLSEFQKDYAHLGESAARLIASSGIRLVGIDYLSIEGFETGEHIVHDIILGAGIIALEGLDLSEVGQGWWRLIALPPKFHGADGSPARVVFEEVI